MFEPVSGAAFSRVGLLGNPGDGYNGKALAAVVRNFSAQVSIEPHEEFVLSAGNDVIVNPDLTGWEGEAYTPLGDQLARLGFAALRRFYLHVAPDQALPTMRVTVTTDIPREVGLAGSSAVIVAMMRALSKLVSRTISPFELAEHALATELEDLGIACGAMDRVIQSYGGALAMELASPRAEDGYAPVDPGLFPTLMLAWDPEGAKPSGVNHGELRGRWLQGDEHVLWVIDELRGLVDQGVQCLEAGDHIAFRELMNRNFELRRQIFAVSERDKQAVAAAWRLGGAAKLCGSGGAIVFAPHDDRAIPDYEAAFERLGWKTLLPALG